MLAECRWPDLAEPYGSALHDAVTFILGRYEPLGIVASGTIVRGAPDPNSDLDLFVIHAPLERQRLQRRFHGVPAEIFVNPPAAVRKSFTEEQADGRPLAAHMLATGFVILARDVVVEELRSEAANLLDRPPVLSEEQTTWERYIAASMLEDAVDVAPRDAAAANALLVQAVLAMLRFAFLRRGLFAPRAKDLIAATVELDDELGTLARRFFLEGSHETKLALAGQIADRTIEAQGFFEWDSPVTIVEPDVHRDSDNS